VAANIYVYFPPDPEGPDREDIAGELEAFFGEAAEDCGAGIGVAGFNLDYSLAEGEDPHTWGDRLKQFLASVGVRPGTKFDVFPNGWVRGMQWRRVEVFGEDRVHTQPPGK